MKWVSKVKPYEGKKIDKDYFEDGAIGDFEY